MRNAGRGVQMLRWMLLLGLVTGLAGCQSIEWFSSLSTTATPTPEVTPSPFLQQSSATPTSPSAAETPVIILWLPPQFDPANNTPDAALLQQRLEQFMSENPGVRIEVRVKAGSGPGGLLDSLSAAAPVAPSVMPGVVALSRSDLESAALKGLIYPLDVVYPEGLGEDWFAYARDAATIQRRLYGLPFAGDALALIYRPAAVGAPPASWEDILRRGRAVALAPAGDALSTLVLYLGAGGAVQDENGLPTLQHEALLRVLNLYQDGAQRGIFPSWVAGLQSDGQVWQTFLEQRADWALTWCSHYLSDLPPNTVLHPIPALQGGTLTLANVWAWAVADPDPARRAMSIRLAIYLSDPDFLSQWAPVAGYLPTRVSVLNTWSDANLRPLLAQVAESARILPANPVLDGLRPILITAAQQVLKGQTDPLTATNIAVEQLHRP